jgi:hypothetical protein
MKALRLSLSSTVGRIKEIGTETGVASREQPKRRPVQIAPAASHDANEAIMD